MIRSAITAIRYLSILPLCRTGMSTFTLTDFGAEIIRIVPETVAIILEIVLPVPGTIARDIVLNV
jgi:hypothetical protein